MALSKTSAVFRFTRNLPIMSRIAYSDDAGAIRQAGGVFSEKERAAEAAYFHKQEQEQLKKLKQHMEEEIKFHEEQINKHKDSINAHEQRIADLKAKHPH